MNKKDLIKDDALMGTPAWFAKEVLKLEPYGWQEKVMWDVALAESPVALRAANGSGKTQNVAAPLILWHCAAFPNSQVVTTAGVYRQVKEQLWGSLRAHKDKLGNGWAINQTDITAPNGSRAVGFSTDDPGKFEGWHNDHLFMIVDEAKSVPDELFMAIERCQPERLLIMSSAGSTTGEFASAFLTRKEFYSTHTVTSYDCPHLKSEWIDLQIRKWGRTHPLVRSMIFSEFIDDGGVGYVVSRTSIVDCLEKPPKHEDAVPLVFIDWAAGGDENVMAFVRGNELKELVCWRDRNTMAAAGRAIAEIKKRNVPTDRVWADDGGLGHPINDALAEAGVQVRRVLNNARSYDPDHYANLGSELWYDAARLIENKEVILLEDETLIEQMSSRRTRYTAQGKLGLESKEDMRNRGVQSPDRADAALSALSVAHRMGNVYDGFAFEEPTEWENERDLTVLENEWSGAFAGL
jgi:phage terminase large subunit